MKVVSFFAGCGGLDLGFRQAGFDVVWANELEPHCRATYTRNHPDTEFVVGDICRIDLASIPDCDGFIGGPPCQSWSVGGKMKGLDDERGKLFLKYIELIHVKQPKFFVIENVKGMLDDKFKDVFEDFIIRLEQAGYDVQWSLLDSVGSSLKRDGDLDFDIRFEDEDFYGDLKASDIKKRETPGNDQKNLIECIYQYGKFWYIIYEHETVKDSEATGYEATKGRNNYIKTIDSSYDKDEMSYHVRMKNSVKFVKMSIIELNRVNYREALTQFNQGRQPDGNARKPKFNINKKVLENDNFVVFRYTYNQ